MAGRSFLIRSPKEESDAAVKGSSVPVSDPVPILDPSQFDFNS